MAQISNFVSLPGTSLAVCLRWGQRFNMLNNWLAQILSPRVPQNPSKTETHFVICRFSKDKVSESAETLEGSRGSFLPDPSGALHLFDFVRVSLCYRCVRSATAPYLSSPSAVAWRTAPKLVFFCDILRCFHHLSARFSKYIASRQSCHVLPLSAGLSSGWAAWRIDRVLPSQICTW